MTERYKVVFTGTLARDADLEQAVEALAARFGMHPQRVRDMLESGSEVVVESGLSALEAEEHRDALEQAGLAVRIEPPLDEGGERMLPADPAGRQAGDFHPPRRVAAIHGWLWLKLGFAMVFANPVHWIGALLIWTILNLLLGLIPLVNVLSALLAPVFMGGVMLGACEQDTGRGFRIERLLAGFSRHFGPLFLVGVLYMLGFIAVVLVMVAVLGGFFSIVAETPLPDAAPVPEVVSTPVAWFPIVLVFAMVVPLVMGYWFSPALVMLDQIPPLRAMSMSFQACLKNVLPFLLYGLVMILLFMLGSIPFLLGLIIVIPAAVASVYAAYRDIFRG